MLYATREKDTEQTRLARKDGKIEYTEEKITQKGNQVSFISSGWSTTRISKCRKFPARDENSMTIPPSHCRGGYGLKVETKGIV